MHDTTQGQNRYDWLEFGESHNPVWATNAVAIGLTVAQTTNYTAFVESAREAAKAATQAWYDAAGKMKENGSGLISAIRTTTIPTSTCWPRSRRRRLRPRPDRPSTRPACRPS